MLPRVAYSRWAVPAAAVAFLALFAGLALWFARTTSATFDESGLMVAGYSYARRQGPEISTTNLRLVPLWLALPLLPQKPHLPDRIGSTSRLITHEEVRLGREFLADPRNDSTAMLRASRAANIILGVILGGVLFAWSRRLHGDAAGLLTVGLYSLNPVLISNSAIATTDVATSLLFVMAVAALWRLVHQVSLATIAICGVACGALATAKLSWVLLLPVATAVLVVRLIGRRELQFGWPLAPASLVRRRSWIYLSTALVLAGAVACATLWAVYGFHYTGGAPLPDEFWVISTRPDATFVQRCIAALHRWRLLPEAYLYDLQTFTVTGGLRRAFLLGEYSVDGWWYFFPVVWFFKTPPAFLIALLLATVAAVRAFARKRSRIEIDFYGLTPLFALGGIYTAAAMTGTLNVGIRHLLPAFPLLFIFAGVLARLPHLASRTRISLIGGVLVWSAAELAWSKPDYLAYANFFAGGSKNGYRVMADSSYEWGQDLPALTQWLAKRNANPGAKPPVYFSYFGNAELGKYKIDAVLLPQYAELRPPTLYPLGPGTYVISATMLQSIYGDVMGPWRPTLEQHYNALTADMIRAQQTLAAGGRAALDKMADTEGAAAWIKKIRRYDQLRFGRLCAWLRQREPNARITCGLLVYELSEADVRSALFGPPAELRQNYMVKGAANVSEDFLEFVK